MAARGCVTSAQLSLSSISSALICLYVSFICVSGRVCEGLPGPSAPHQPAHHPLLHDADDRYDYVFSQQNKTNSLPLCLLMTTEQLQSDVKQPILTEAHTSV